MKEEPKFKVGETVVCDINGYKGVVLEIHARDESFVEKYYYIVEFEKDGFWGKYKFIKRSIGCDINKILNI